MKQIKPLSRGIQAAGRGGAVQGPIASHANEGGNRGMAQHQRHHTHANQQQHQSRSRTRPAANGVAPHHNNQQKNGANAHPQGQQNQ